MSNLPSIRLGTLFGIPVEINVSWFVIFLLVAVTLTTGYFPQQLEGRSNLTYAIMGIVTTLAFFASVLIHEFAHSLVARAGGLRIARVTLFIFGGVSQMEDEPRRPGLEFVMASAGPGTSILLAAMFFLAGEALFLFQAEASIIVVLDYLAVINLSVGVFNLLPGFPLDGGRILRAVLWAITGDMLKATRWASRMGQLIGVALISVAVIGVLLYQTFDLIWFAVMGWFISGLATTAYQQQVVKSRLAQVSVAQIMSAPAVVVSADLTLEDMAHSYFLGGRHSRYPVVADGTVVGLVDIKAAQKVRRDDWPVTTVADVAYKDLSCVYVGPETTVDSILPQLDPMRAGVVFVVDGGRLSGIVSRADVIRLISDDGDSTP
ncbi:MAG: site-2 protease family protein [Coriobacteriia bacterium]|nr:site-2 protease family protein [Coriobacteriia bacterium]MBN2822933.1 site-2 protease family protein [Coriobacteriia bacterium]